MASQLQQRMASDASAVNPKMGMMKQRRGEEGEE